MVRGSLNKGERCAIPGVGPISLASTTRLAEEGIIKLILTDGPDVRDVISRGRTLTPRQEAALAVRDPVCVIPGCNVAQNLENHHWDEPFCKTGRTRLCEVCRVCHWHHLLITHCGWRVIGGPGKWQWIPPARN